MKNQRFYSKNKHCKCGKLISNKAIRCKKCYGKIVSNRQLGTNNPYYKHGEYMNNKLCIDCGKRISCHSIRCQKCALSIIKSLTHHKDLNRSNNNESNLIHALSRSKHVKLHQRAYEYLVGLGMINKYIKWFDKKYQLMDKKT